MKIFGAYKGENNTYKDIVANFIMNIDKKIEDYKDIKTF